MNSKNKLHLLSATILGALAAGTGNVRAGEKAGATSPPPASPLPTPDYSGDFLARSTMTGDWGGLRNDLAKKGLTVDLNLTQTYMGVVDGGVNQGWEYGGRADFVMNLDTGKMGLWPGGFFSVEAEYNYGEGGNLNTGALLPSNTSAILPVPGNPGELSFPAVTYTQFFSKKFGVMVGKIQTLAADDNAFAHGKGDKQFMNIAMNANPVALFTAP